MSRRTFDDFSRMDQAISEGKLWRAKEILQGRVCNSFYDPTLYEKYGGLLLQMGDLIEAGRWLFLSGKRAPEYQTAIELYLQRHGKHGWATLKSSIPKYIRELPLTQFPEALQPELIKLGHKGQVVAQRQIGQFQPLQRGILKWLVALGFALMIIFSFIGVIATMSYVGALMKIWFG